MRLIHTTEHYIKTFNFDVPPYAILSHRWAKDDADEISYQDLIMGTKKDSLGYRKILRFCEIALAKNAEWAWVDTACIDKSSSAELSESINSMFRFYEQAEFCCIFLLPSDCEILRTEHFEQIPTWTSSTGFVHHDVQVLGINADSWFSRGWTLQELLAPRTSWIYVVRDDFSTAPAYLGDKTQLATQLTTITGIPRDYLTGDGDFREATVAQRMSWASKRTTSRPEDVAYCLLGIFEINMPLLYGEGDRAFQRLQEAILLQIDDESILAWASKAPADWSGILASSPADFVDCGCLRIAHGSSVRPPLSVSSKGIQLHVAIDSWNKILTPSFSGYLLLAKLFGPSEFIEEISVPLQCSCSCEGTNKLPRWSRRTMAIVLQRCLESQWEWGRNNNRGSWIRKRPHEPLEIQEDSGHGFWRGAALGYVPIFCQARARRGRLALVTDLWLDTRLLHEVHKELTSSAVVFWIFLLPTGLYPLIRLLLLSWPSHGLMTYTCLIALLSSILLWTRGDTLFVKVLAAAIPITCFLPQLFLICFGWGVLIAIWPSILRPLFKNRGI